MSTTVFERARIVDPSRGIDEVGSVIVEGRKIVAAGKAALNQGVPEGATVIDPHLANATERVLANH